MYVCAGHLAVRRPAAEVEAFAARHRLTARIRTCGAWTYLDIPLDDTDRIVSVGDLDDLEQACEALSTLGTPAVAVNEAEDGFVAPTLGQVHGVDAEDLPHIAPDLDHLTGWPSEPGAGAQLAIVSKHDPADLVIVATAIEHPIASVERDGWTVVGPGGHPPRPGVDAAVELRDATAMTSPAPVKATWGEESAFSSVEVAAGLAASRGATGLAVEVVDGHLSVMLMRRSRAVGAVLFGVEHRLLGGNLLAGHPHEDEALDALGLFSVDPRRVLDFVGRGDDADRAAALGALMDEQGLEPGDVLRRLAELVGLPDCELLVAALHSPTAVAQAPGAVVTTPVSGMIRAWAAAVRADAGFDKRPGCYPVVCTLLVPVVAFALWGAVDDVTATTRTPWDAVRVLFLTLSLVCALGYAALVVSWPWRRRAARRGL